MLGFGVVVDSTHLWTARPGLPPDIALEPDGRTLSRIRVDIDEGDTPDTIMTLVDGPPGVAERAAEFAAPVAGSACTFASVDDERPAVRTYEGRIGEISDDRQFRISMRSSLPEYHTVVGSPVLVADVVVGLLTGSAGTGYVDAVAWSRPVASEDKSSLRQDA
jgi:hypothetical protein